MERQSTWHNEIKNNLEQITHRNEAIKKVKQSQLHVLNDVI